VSDSVDGLIVHSQTVDLLVEFVKLVVEVVVADRGLLSASA